MQTFFVLQSKIHPIVRAILLQGDKMVLCRAKGNARFFLPGGHIENGSKGSTFIVEVPVA
ncbi:MAG: hypothetical protein WCG84_02135 [Candidatus Moraniibacteriota bacterium]